MLWVNELSMPHARLSGGLVLRITERTETTPEINVCHRKEIITLEKLTGDGWVALQSSYHYPDRNDERGTNMRRRTLTDELKKYAAFLYGDR